MMTLEKRDTASSNQAIEIDVRVSNYISISKRVGTTSKQTERPRRQTTVHFRRTTNDQGDGWDGEERIDRRGADELIGHA